MKFTRFAICFALVLITAVASAQTDTTFTFQGELSENGTPANGAYNMAFILFDDGVGGIVVGTPVVHGAMPVVDGKFTAPLDFGGSAFEDNRWLEIEVNGVPLTPRTPITHAPYSIQTRGIFVDDGGYVGIGTNNPGAGLAIESSAGYGSAVALDNTGGGLEWRLTSWTDGTFRLVKTSGTTFSAMVVEPIAGRVGIGTSSPDQKLSVHNSEPGISYLRVSDFTSGANSGLRVGMSGSGNAYIINDESLSLSLGTSGTSQVRINDIGYVGINDLNPETMLHVKQDVANRAIRTEHQSTTNNWETGIGTTTNNYKFYYNDLFRADISSVDGAYVQSSDRQLKQDVQEMPTVLDKVNRLQPSSYLYLDNTDGGPRSIGFIAQDVESLFPDLVRETDEGTKGLVYDGFAVISIKAIQELDSKVDQLEAENDELRTRLGSLEQLVEQLAFTEQENTK